MPTVHFIHGVSTDSDRRIATFCKKVEDERYFARYIHGLTGNLAELKSETAPELGSYNIFSATLGYKQRLLLVSIFTECSTQRLVVFKYLPNHEYEDFRARLNNEARTTFLYQIKDKTQELNGLIQTLEASPDAALMIDDTIDSDDVKQIKLEIQKRRAQPAAPTPSIAPIRPPLQLTLTQEKLLLSDARFKRISGIAGAGKTEMVKQAMDAAMDENKSIFLMTKSARLAKEIQKHCENHPNYDPTQVLCLTWNEYVDYLRTTYSHTWLAKELQHPAITQEQFRQWFTTISINRHVAPKFFQRNKTLDYLQVRICIETLFAHAKKWLSKDEYKKISPRLLERFLPQELDREEFYLIVQSYQKYLTEHDLIDPSIQAFLISRFLTENQGNIIQFDNIIGDEDQLNTPEQRLAHMMMGKSDTARYLFAGDENQNLYQEANGHAELHRYLSSQGIDEVHFYFEESYRNSECVFNVANSFHEMQRSLFGKKQAIEALTNARCANIDNKGFAECIDRLSEQDIHTIQNDADFVVIVFNPKDKSELIARGISETSIFFIDEVAGLEFKRVLMMNPLSLYPKLDLDRFLQKALSDIETSDDKENYSPLIRSALTMLYVAVTRATEGVVFCGPFFKTLLKDSVSHIAMLSHATLSTPLDWLMSIEQYQLDQPERAKKRLYSHKIWPETLEEKQIQYVLISLTQGNLLNQIEWTKQFLLMRDQEQWINVLAGLEKIILSNKAFQEELKACLDVDNVDLLVTRTAFYQESLVVEPVKPTQPEPKKTKPAAKTQPKPAAKKEAPALPPNKPVATKTKEQEPKPAANPTQPKAKAQPQSPPTATTSSNSSASVLRQIDPPTQQSPSKTPSFDYAVFADDTKVEECKTLLRRFSSHPHAVMPNMTIHRVLTNSQNTCTPLGIAMDNEQLGMVKFLVENCYVDSNYTPIFDHHPSYQKISPLIMAINMGWIKIAEYLCDAGASPFIHHDPLLLIIASIDSNNSSKQAYFPLVIKLLQNGACINADTYQKLATIYPEQKEEIYKLYALFDQKTVRLKVFIQQINSANISAITEKLTANDWLAYAYDPLFVEDRTMVFDWAFPQHTEIWTLLQQKCLAVASAPEHPDSLKAHLAFMRNTFKVLTYPDQNGDTLFQTLYHHCIRNNPNLFVSLLDNIDLMYSFNSDPVKKLLRCMKEDFYDTLILQNRVDLLKKFAPSDDHIEALQTLKKDIHHHRINGMTLLEYAIHHNSEALFDFCLEYGANLNTDPSPLISAVQKDRLRMTMKLAANGATSAKEPLLQDAKALLPDSATKATLITFLERWDDRAVREKMTQKLFEAVAKGDLDTLRKELKINGDEKLRYRNQKDDTLLTQAVQFNRLDSICYLVENYPSIQIDEEVMIIKNIKRTPFEFACGYKNKAIASYLIKHNAAFDRLLFSTVIEPGEEHADNIKNMLNFLYELLTEKIPDKTERDKLISTITVPITKKPFINEQRNTLLIFAIRYNNIAIMQWALDHGASVHDISRSPKCIITPLTSAIGLGRLAIIKILLSKGAEINHVDWSQNALTMVVFMHFTASSSVDQIQPYCEIIQMLLEHGADPTLECHTTEDDDQQNAPPGIIMSRLMRLLDRCPQSVLSDPAFIAMRGSLHKNYEERLAARAGINRPGAPQ